MHLPTPYPPHPRLSEDHPCSPVLPPARAEFPSAGFSILVNVVIVGRGSFHRRPPHVFGYLPEERRQTNREKNTTTFTKKKRYVGANDVRRRGKTEIRVTYLMLLSSTEKALLV